MDFELLKSIWDQLVAQFVNSLPKVITLLLVIVLGWIAARVLAGLVGRLIKRTGLDGFFERSVLAQGLEKAQIEQSFSKIASGLIFWLLWLYVVIAALAGSGQMLAATPFSDALSFMPHIFAAFLVLVGGILLAQLLGSWAQTATAAAGVEFHAAIGQGLRLTLIVVAVILSIQQLGIDLTPLTNALINLLTVVVAGLSLAFGLGARDVVRNLLAGYYAREHFALGDQIEIGGETGALEAIGTVSAEISLPDGLMVIPNCDLTEKATKVLKVK